MKVFYFTATGNSLHVAKTIGGELCSIPQICKMNQKDFSDDAIGFVFPCYALGVPRIVAEFIKNGKFHAEYFFAVMTYGGMGAAGVKMAEDIGRQCGITFDYTAQIEMVDNQKVIVYEQDEIGKAQSEKVEARIRQVAGDIQKRKRSLYEAAQDALMMTKFGYADLAENYLDGNDSKYTVADGCVECHICENVCPAGNITVSGKPVFLHRCEACYACIHACPKKIINREYVSHEPPEFQKEPYSDARYLNPNIKLKEIIASNKIK